MIQWASVCLALAGALLMAPEAWGKRPRPPDAPPGSVVTSVALNELQLHNDYATAERTLSSQAAVVHYVVTGIDAPPLNDDDRDGVPDYVEQVAEVADVSIAYYRGRGFVRIRPDRGVPDPRPDVYVSRVTPGSFGVALPSVRAEGGAFVVVSDALDPSCMESLGSVCGTVAHELFHLVQFSYAPEEADLARVRPVLEIGLAELLKSQPKSETTIALRNLNIVNGRAVINTEDGNQIEIPVINLDAQNINLGGQTDVALRAEPPPLGGIADFAIERRDSTIALKATVIAKQPNRLFNRNVATNAQPLLQAEAALRMALGQEATINVDLKFNQLKLAGKELNGQLKVTAALDQKFTAGSFSSELDFNDFPNSISPVALQVSDGPASVIANGAFSVSAKSATIKALTLRSHLGRCTQSHCSAARRLTRRVR